MRCLVVAGPTACRKTELALGLAGALGGEVVCADSVQLLQGFEIGAAAPTAEERARAPHHLFNAWDPTTPPDAGAWTREADRVISEIAARGRVPIVVGGTGLYLRALLDGLAEIPPVAPEVRERLAAELASDGIWPLWERLVAGDPEAAERIQGGERNTQRVLRALEVLEGTGKALSAYHREQVRGRGYAATYLVPRFPLEVLGPRLDARVEQMMAAGFLDEVRALLARGLTREQRSLKALGYNELAAHLAGELSEWQAVEAIQRGHRAYARRQRTWFNSVRGAVPLDAQRHDLLAQALDAWRAQRVVDGTPAGG